VDRNTLALDAIGVSTRAAASWPTSTPWLIFRNAQWSPRLIDRRRFDNWQTAGAQDMFERANQRARQILERHQAPALPAEAEAVIQEILEERAAARG